MKQTSSKTTKQTFSKKWGINVLTLDEILRQLEPSQSVVVYTTKRAGLIVGYRLQDVSDHSHTILIECHGDEHPAVMHHQFHGHARYIGDQIMRDNGAHYFEAWYLNPYSKKHEKRNQGRV